MRRFAGAIIKGARAARRGRRGALLLALGGAAALMGPAVAQPNRPAGPPPMVQRPPMPPRAPSLPPRAAAPSRPSFPPRTAPARPPVALPAAADRAAGRGRPLDLPAAARRSRGAAAATGIALQERELLRRHPQLIDADPRGAPAIRGEVIAVSPTPEALAAALAAGFSVREESRLDALDLVVVVLAAPPGESSQEAVRRLRRADPTGQYEFNHIYFGAAATGASGAAAPPAGPRAAPAAARVGLVDGGVAAAHPALRGASVTQRSFASGEAAPTAHGTAVASLLVGSMPGFRGAAPGARLYAADVYGDKPTGGSADAILRALAWLAQEGVRVINVSLVGPPNATLEAAMKSLARRGHVVVAAVGNDGPAAPPRYPAAYPQTVAVTGLDRRRKPLLEAGRGSHVDFSAPGAEMAAAGPAGGLAAVRGTSFAAPLVAGRLAALDAQQPGRSGEALVSALAAEAVDLGARGRDPVYGMGLVAERLRVSPPR